MNRLELKVTYQCTSKCDHCLYCSSNQSKRVISRECMERVIDQTRPREAVLFTGGEASVEPDLVLHGMAYAKQLGIDSWLITNGSWGKDVEFAEPFAAKMVSNGLKRVNFSVDYLHQEHIPFAWVSTAITACKSAGVKTIRAMITFVNRGHGIAQDYQTEELLRQVSQIEDVELDIRPRVTFAGRALTTLGDYGPQVPLVDVLQEKPCNHASILDSPYEIVGPEGKVFICSGFAFPGNLLTMDFGEIVCQNNVNSAQIVSSFQTNGIRGLYELALGRGYSPLSFYKSGCHLCLDTRKYLRTVFPECLVPDFVYGYTCAEQDDSPDTFGAGNL